MTPSARAGRGPCDEVAKLTGAKTDQQAKVDRRRGGAQGQRRSRGAANRDRRSGEQAARKLEPASVFISRKTQRLYVRQAFEPVLGFRS